MVAFTFKKQIATKPEDCPDIINDMQDSSLEIVRNLNSLPLNQSVLLTDVALSTTAALVTHNLGFKARGFICVNPSASFNLYEDTSLTNPDRNKYIYLRLSSGSYSVNLIIF